MAKVIKGSKNKTPVSLVTRQADLTDVVLNNPYGMTLLQSQNIPMTKVYGPGLKSVKTYSKAKHFTPYIASPASIHELSAVITETSADFCLCIVRGQLINAKAPITRRIKESIADTPRYWFMVDLDGFPPPTEFDWRDDPARATEWAIKTYLPEPFWNAAFHYSFSSSAGMKKGLRIHLWFWLATPANSKTLKTYFKPIQEELLAKYNPEKLKDDDIQALGEQGVDIFPSFLDIGIYDEIQVHYNAVPQFEVPSEDPLAGRTRQGLVAEGRGMTVALPDSKAAAKDWVPAREDLLNMIPALILHYPKLVDQWDGTFPSPWKKIITAFKHHLVKVLGIEDGEAFDLVEREFSQKLRGATTENRRHWENSSIDLPPGEGGQITVWSLVKLAEAEGYQGPAGARSSAGTEFFNDWMYAVSIKQFVNIKTLLEYDKEQFNAVFLSDFAKGMPHDLVLRNSLVKTINATTYWPDKPRFVEEAAFNIGILMRKLNYWNPPIINAQEGDVSPFLDHVKYMYPDPYEAGILLDYLAFQVQFPGEKVHWALMLQGPQGIGKSYITEPLKHALGHWNVKEIAAKLLHEDFNGWQKNCQVIIVEEMMARGRMEMMNNLKPQITQPWHQIREMYKPPYWIPNRFNFIFLTNHKDAIIIDETDRRYCVLASKALPHPDGILKYYKPLFQWTKANGPALVHYFQHRSLAKFVPQAHAPMTEGKLAMIEESRTPLQEFIHRRVEAREWPFNVDLVSPDELAEKVLPQFNLRAHPQAVGKAFASLGYTKLGYRRFGEKQQTGEYEQISLWAVRNSQTYEKKTTQDIRNDWYCQVVTSQMEINNGLDPDTAALAQKKGVPDRPYGGINVAVETAPMSAGNIPPREDRRKKPN